MIKKLEVYQMHPLPKGVSERTVVKEIKPAAIDFVAYREITDPRGLNLRKIEVNGKEIWVPVRSQVRSSGKRNAWKTIPG